MTHSLPKLEICATAPEAAARAAHAVAERIGGTGLRVLGLATGGTMVPFYAELVAAARRRRLSFREITSFNLDEYIGVPAAAATSFSAYMEHHLFAQVDLDPGRAHLPDGSAADPDAEAARYERAIAEAGGVDLQVLGIGRNGHIGFNEPGSDFGSRTRAVRLSPQTRSANAADFAGGPVPERALTMGIATILDARAILLLATGPQKAGAVTAALEGPVSPACPASALRLHPNVRVICDEAAAGLLGKREARLSI